jgi:hypothetical protein
MRWNWVCMGGGTATPANTSVSMAAAAASLSFTASAARRSVEGGGGRGVPVQPHLTEEQPGLPLRAPHPDMLTRRAQKGDTTAYLPIQQQCGQKRPGGERL